MRRYSRYRSHNCGELTERSVGKRVKLSGWVCRKRDHGKILFVDLRDHFGITQLVLEESNPFFEQVSAISCESVISVEGKVLLRAEEYVNCNLNTGAVEVGVDKVEVLSESEPLPFEVSADKPCSEELRLRYRFLDLRRKEMHQRMVLRSKVVSYIRGFMESNGFIEFSTPILASSSPEGARDFLVPSRLHKGKFYALPQAPQQFKQLLMMSGFDRYFQIAPCFRDEDPRADRSPGEFYQLDIEMSFVEAEDVFAITEKLLRDVFNRFGSKDVSPLPFKRMSYAEAMLRYGTDKPDLRNPLVISDATEVFADTDFTIFKNNIAMGMAVRAIPSPGSALAPRSFFDSKIDFAKSLGASGLAYVALDQDGNAKGPIAKFFPPGSNLLKRLKDIAGIDSGDAVFFSCEQPDLAAQIAGELRVMLGKELGMVGDGFMFCWITDFPFYQRNPENGRIEFCHNPFSMPRGGLEALCTLDPLEVIGEQYDIVCNGIELSSGAIRNHNIEVMYKAFEIAGYSAEKVDSSFGAVVSALKFGAPPHGGIAPGIDRMMMLLTGAENIREVICFPKNQKAEDLLMGSPSGVASLQLKELGICLQKKLDKDS